MKHKSFTRGIGTVLLMAGLAACGSGEGGSGGGGTLPGAGGVPADVTTFSATAAGSSAINLKWSEIADLKNYTLERKTTGGSYAALATPAANATSYGDTALTADTAYTYRLKTVNAVGSSAGKEASATTSEVTTPPGGGADNSALIFNAGTGDFALAEPQTAPVIADTTTKLTDTQPGELGSVTCTVQGKSASQIRSLEDTIALNPGAESIYPGALIQGQSFLGGAFQPITIARAGGTIYLTGLATDPKNKVYRNLDEITGAKVAQARQEILATDPKGTEANLSFTSDVTYSQNDLLFKLGVDGRYGTATLKANLKVDNTKSKNFVFLKFQQVFYTLTFEPPNKSTDVFRDGKSFDPNQQIGTGNPPMYISSVKYGRLVFLVAESEYSQSALNATLNAAYSGGVASVKVEGDLTAKDVFSHSSIYYYAVGGDAGQAVGPISANTPDEMYDKVRGLLSNARNARYSAANPGAPIAYTLRYLQDNKLARVSYVATYDQKNCTYLAPPIKAPKLEIEFNNIDDSVWVDVNGKSVLVFASFLEGKASTGRINMTNWLVGGDNQLHVRLKNDMQFKKSLSMTIYKDGLPVSLGLPDDKTTRTYSQDYFADFDTGFAKLNWLYKVNKINGNITRLDHFLNDKDCEAKGPDYTDCKK